MNPHLLHHAGSSVPLEAMTRRGAVKLSLGAALGAVLGPTLPRAFCQESTAPASNEKSVILLWLAGGPFQHDSFDPKDCSDEKVAIKFKPIDTAAPQLKLAACMPKLAEQAQHLTVIRSMLGHEMEHSLAQYHMQTGWRNTGPLQAPAIGSIVSHELGPVAMRRARPDGLPAYISIGHAGYTAGHFGSAYRPTIVWDPTQPPENLGLPTGTSPEAFDRRLALLRAVEQGGRQGPLSRRYAGGRDGAVRFMRSKQRSAFQLDQEPDKLRDEYGRSKFGQGCLLARRLVEAGVRFVQVTHENFDQHADHYPRQEQLMGQLDVAMARLMVDLNERGLLEHTLIVAAGEFGRTPIMNKNKGRDHWVNGYSVGIAGGNFKGGFAYGRTKSDGADIEEDPVSIPDFMATLLHAAGIDPQREYLDGFDRPIKLVDDGEVIGDLLA